MSESKNAQIAAKRCHGKENGRLTSESKNAQIAAKRCHGKESERLTSGSKNAQIAVKKIPTSSRDSQERLNTMRGQSHLRSQSSSVNELQNLNKSSCKKLCHHHPSSFHHARSRSKSFDEKKRLKFRARNQEEKKTNTTIDEMSER
jgi:hypothetical protein